MKNTKHILNLMLLAALLAGISSGRAADPKATEAKPYPTAKCLVSGEALDSMGKPIVTVFEKQELKFCCNDCVKTFEKDKAAYMKKVAAAEAKAKPYTLTTCVVSGDKFDHGAPTVFAYEDQQVKLCCADCLKEFKKEPVKFLKKITSADRSRN